MKMDLLSFICLCLLSQLHFMGYISDKYQWVYNAVAFTKPFPGRHLGQPSLTFLEPGRWRTTFSTNQGVGDGLGMIQAH